MQNVHDRTTNTVKINQDTSKVANNKAESSKKKRVGYIDGLKRTLAFSIAFDEYRHIFKILILLFRLITVIFYTVYYLIKSIVIFIVSLCKQSKIITVITILVLAFAVWTLVDFIMFNGKIYPGVKVGEIDLGYKTQEEANQLISDTYSSRLNGNSVIIYANEEAQSIGEEAAQNAEINQELSVDEARKNVQYWKVNSTELEAFVPVEDLTSQAYNEMRSPFCIFSRIGALMFGRVIKPYVTYNNDAHQLLLNKLNDTLGTPMVNPTCVIEDGNASAQAGVDGNMIIKDEFTNQLDTAFLAKDTSDCNFVPNIRNVKQNISFGCADSLSKKLNKILSTTISFTYKNTSWTEDGTTFGKWIDITIEDKADELEKKSGCSCSSIDNNTNYAIVASINNSRASLDIVANTRSTVKDESNISISLQNKNGEIIVVPNQSTEIPSTTTTVKDLNNRLMSDAVSYENSYKSDNPEEMSIEQNTKIYITSSSVPEYLSVDDAVRLGIMSTISEYTTAYSTGAGSESRNHNIALCAQLLNNSICTANGGTWSFNDIAGECNEEKGFQNAGVVVGNKYEEGVGGGICQVATTVFNSVYDSGFPIPIRKNHDLHIASYPAGRDAAISWPGPDLGWTNDSNSDVLVQVTTTGYSVTCALLGVDPGYTVETETGEWGPGDHYTTEVVVDPSKEENSSFIQTSGSDGKSITVKRKVYDKNGNLIREDEFVSVYKPKTEIRVIGPGKEAEELLAKKEARMKDEQDKW